MLTRCENFKSEMENLNKKIKTGLVSNNNWEIPPHLVNLNRLRKACHTRRLTHSVTMREVSQYHSVTQFVQNTLPRSHLTVITRPVHLPNYELQTAPLCRRRAIFSISLHQQQLLARHDGGLLRPTHQRRHCSVNWTINGGDASAQDRNRKRFQEPYEALQRLPDTFIHLCQRFIDGLPISRAATLP